MNKTVTTNQIAKDITNINRKLHFELAKGQLEEAQKEIKSSSFNLIIGITWVAIIALTVINVATGQVLDRAETSYRAIMQEAE